MRGHLNSVCEIACGYLNFTALFWVLDGRISHFLAAFVEQLNIQRAQVVNFVAGRVLNRPKADFVFVGVVNLYGHIHRGLRIGIGFRCRYRDVGYVVWRSFLEREVAVCVHGDVALAAALDGVAERTVALGHLCANIFARVGCENRHDGRLNGLRWFADGRLAGSQCTGSGWREIGSSRSVLGVGSRIRRKRQARHQAQRHHQTEQDARELRSLRLHGRLLYSLLQFPALQSETYASELSSHTLL